MNMSNGEINYSKVLPVWKFALFSIASMGLYQYYWNYKSWKFLNEKEDLNVSPFWRTFFMPIFMTSLFDSFSDMFNNEGRHVKYSTANLVLVWLLLNMVGRYLEGPFVLVYVLSFVALIPLLSDLNMYWSEKSPELSEKPFTKKEIIFLTIGILFFLSVFMSLFLE